jgi:hypothetical protein
MPRQRKKTVGDALQQIKELEQRAAIQRTLVTILRSRYLPSDASPQPSAQIPCNGAPVNVEIIEEVVEELEDGVEEMLKAANVYRAEEVVDV